MGVPQIIHFGVPPCMETTIFIHIVRYDHEKFVNRQDHPDFTKINVPFLGPSPKLLPSWVPKNHPQREAVQGEGVVKLTGGHFWGLAVMASGSSFESHVHQGLYRFCAEFWPSLQGLDLTKYIEYH